MNLIQSTILTSLPAGKKKTPSGWIAFNAPCCIHNGENADRRKRGGIMIVQTAHFLSIVLTAVSKLHTLRVEKYL